MSGTSSADAPADVFAFAGFRAAGTLEDVAAALSESVFGGVPFGGRTDAVRDEVPAVYTLRPVLGLRAVLYGKAGKYTLALKLLPGQNGGAAEIDLSGHLKALLRRAGRFEVD